MAHRVTNGESGNSIDIKNSVNSLKTERINITLRRALPLSEEEYNNWVSSNKSLSTQQPETQTGIKPTTNINFQGYKGGFDNTGKGTPLGDGKDKAMRQVADGFIGEHKPVNIQTSTRTSFNDITFKLQEREGVRQGNSNFAFETQDKFSKNYDHRYEGKSGKTEIIGVFKNPKVVMLARNGEYKGEYLNDNTKGLILEAYNQGAEFVVGDMPGVDSQFIDYLQEIGAKFTIYHTGDTPRIKVNETIDTNDYTTGSAFGDVNECLT
jgi:hypothetical protein